MDTVRVDIVSDVACPWCAIGYRRLEEAMGQLTDEFNFEIHWHPFELNPDMPPEGEPIVEHLASRYGCSEADVIDTQDGIMEAAEALGLDFSAANERRAHNTFDAHRILSWAAERGQMREFQLALFDAYFGAARNPSDRDVLATIAGSLGLDSAEVDAILDSDRYAETVRQEQARFYEAGVTAVPAFIVNRQYLISGAREPDMLVDAFRRIATDQGERASTA